MSGDRKHPLFFNGLGDPEFTIEPTASDTSPKPSITLAFLRRDVPTPRPPSPRPPSPGAISSSAATRDCDQRLQGKEPNYGHRTEKESSANACGTACVGRGTVHIHAG